jgi:hypothetical protein
MKISKPKIIPVLLLLAVFETAQAADDGARAYWKTMEDTNFLSFQKLEFNADASDSQFDPSFGIYPNSETDMDIFVLMYGRQMNLFGRSAMFSASIDISSEIGIDNPFDSTSIRSRQTASGFGDPSLGLTVNLHGAPNIANFYDMANYDTIWQIMSLSGPLTCPGSSRFLLANTKTIVPSILVRTDGGDASHCRLFTI